jgi:hypothetical protein
VATARGLRPALSAAVRHRLADAGRAFLPAFMVDVWHGAGCRSGMF